MLCEGKSISVFAILEGFMVVITVSLLTTEKALLLDIHPREAKHLTKNSPRPARAQEINHKSPEPSEPRDSLAVMGAYITLVWTRDSAPRGSAQSWYLFLYRLM